MFESLFSPLKTAFSDVRTPLRTSRNSVPPIGMSSELQDTPEDFAHDVRVEIVRRTVDELKSAVDLSTQVEQLTQILTVLQEDASMKHVFGESDGFIVLISVLSGLREMASQDGTNDRWQHASHICFDLLIEALKACPRNQVIFERTVGYETLHQSVVPTYLDSRRVTVIAGLLLALAFQDLTLSDFFTMPQLTNGSSLNVTLLDGVIREKQQRWIKLRHPPAIVLLFSISTTISLLPPTTYIIFKTIERIIALSHRNQAMLNEAGLGLSVFQFLYDRQNLLSSIPEEANIVLHKMLRRLMEMGSPRLDQARYLFQSALRESTLQSDVLQTLRSGTRVRWPEFFSMSCAAALLLTDNRGKIFPPPSGLTFLAWIFVERMPSVEEPLVIFGARSSSPSRWIAKLTLLSEGDLEFVTPSAHDALSTPLASVRKGRWTHIALVHHATKASSPTVRLYIDGHEVATQNSVYPKPSPPPTTFHFGCDPSESRSPTCRWSLASCHVIAHPLHGDLPRLIHHLGPRYTGNFQDAALYRFLTYEASTSLNIYMFDHPSFAPNRLGDASGNGISMLSKALVGDFGFTEDKILVSLSTKGVIPDPHGPALSGINVIVNSAQSKSSEIYASLLGDVYVAKLQCFDVNIWRLGGPPIALKLIQASATPSDLNLALCLLFDIVRSCWQNSQDMERLQGYDVLTSLLRSKAHLLDRETFDVVFEFMGIDFASPETATIANTSAYRSIGLDFHLWSMMPPDLRRAYWDHFSMVLATSKFWRFNSKHRFGKKLQLHSIGVLGQALFTYQTDLYGDEMVAAMVEAIVTLAKCNWSPEASIKPIVSYLAAKLHQPIGDNVASPHSIHSMVVHNLTGAHAVERAERILEAFVSILTSDSHLRKLNAALPVAHVIVLLLGPSPSPVVVVQILRLVGLHLLTLPLFSRKLDLVGFWGIVKIVLPDAWDSAVHRAAFDLLLGRSELDKGPSAEQLVVKQPQMLLVIIASLERGIQKIVERRRALGDGRLSMIDSEASMEALLEEMIELHSSSPTFRHAFKSKSVLSAFVALTKSFISSNATPDPEAPLNSAPLLDKLIHLALVVNLAGTSDPSQKRELIELVDIIRDPRLALLPETAERRRFSSGAAFKGASDKNSVKALTRVASWRMTIVATEHKRGRKMLQDMRENLRALQRLTHWVTVVHHDQGLWPHASPAKWRLDEAEGPLRVRKKLEPEVEKVFNTHVHLDTAVGHFTDVTDDASTTQLIAPWDGGYEFSVIEDDQGWEDESTEDKHRRIRHELEPGDVIEMVRNVARVVGVDSSPGLFILGKTHLYVRDGLVESSTGDILEALDAPKDVLSVPGTLVSDPDPNQRARRWNLDALAGFSTRTYLFRDVSLEIYFKDSRSLLCVFATKLDRHAVLSKLERFVSEIAADGRASALYRQPMLSLVSFTGKNSQSRSDIDTAQRRWQAREISNFAYLSIINQASGRTPNDLTQYPVFPWLLQDYTSDTLDLTSSNTFRDLSLPMGALSSSRRDAAEARYAALTDIGESPFHYGTHFSSSMTTSHFLIRLSPFNRHFKALQGGDFDLPERLFVDVQRAWVSASQESRGDVRELIPEFFNCPEFLENLSGLELGTKAGGEKIDSVRLPPWARHDPLLFIALHRQALECDYVSRNLPAWIDLIWGCKQRDVASCNVFHPLSYEGAIDLDAIEDPIERAASVGIIHNFGQTPRKIFSSVHPPRFMDGVTTLPLGVSHGIPEHAQLLAQSPRPVRTLQDRVSALFVDSNMDKILACGPGMLIVPNFPHESIEWGFHDQSVRLFVDRKLVQVVEATAVVCATFCGSEVLVTGASHNLVSLWQLEQTSGSRPRLKIAHVMRGHGRAVSCVAASRPWSLIVSVSEDGLAILWDLNRAQYVRSIYHERAVHACAIHENTGDVVTCSIDQLSIYTINGHHIASLRLSPHQRVTSLAFHERETSLVGVLAAGSGDGSIVLRSWNADDTRPGQKAKWKFITLRELKLRREEGDWRPTVTALKFVKETLYCGDEAGRVFAWTLPE